MMSFKQEHISDYTCCSCLEKIGEFSGYLDFLGNKNVR